MNRFAQARPGCRGGIWGAVKAGAIALALTHGSGVAAERSFQAPAAEARREVQVLLETWNHAMTARDTAGIRAAYAEDARFRWFEDGQLRYRSREEIVGALGKFPPGTRIETSLSEIEGEWLGAQRITGSAKFRTRITMPGHSFEYGGVFTLLLEKAEGGWKFLRGHTSTVRPEQTR